MRRGNPFFIFVMIPKGSKVYSKRDKLVTDAGGIEPAI